MNEKVKSAAGPVGVGLVACAACCAGPVLGVIGGLGLAASGVALAFGGLLVALLLAAVAASVLVVRRRRRQRARTCATEAKVDVLVASPVIRRRVPTS